MKIAIASDHAGYELKKQLKDYLQNSFGYEVVDFGTVSKDSVDYPDFAHHVASEVGGDKFERGVLICGSGIGMCMAANRHKNVRAAVLRDKFDAEMSRLHNDSNVACLGARITTLEDCKEILKKWFITDFEAGRHKNRIDKIDQ